MPQLVEPPFPKCLSVLFHGILGRVGFSTPSGPRIVLVDYSIDGDEIIFRANPYSELGTYATNLTVAFEVEELDTIERQGWSVVVTGRCSLVDDPARLDAIRRTWPTTSTAGPRHVYLRLTWDDLSGHPLRQDVTALLLPDAA